MPTAVITTEQPDDSDVEIVTSDTRVTTTIVLLGVAAGAGLTLGAQKLLQKYRAAKAEKNAEEEN